MDEETLACVKTAQKFIEREIHYLFTHMGKAEENLQFHDKSLWEVERDIEELRKDLKSVEQSFHDSPIKHFLKNNWLRLLPFIVALSTVLGALGEYLYRLAPK